jgi:hypothetical protein
VSTEVNPPDAVLANRRWVPLAVVEWVKQADAIMLEHGAVSGSNLYPKRHLARWRAEKLMRAMSDLGLHERWQLAEHSDERDGGWIWTVELLNRGGNSSNGRH